MKTALSTFAFFLLSGCCSLAWATDEFGPRFGSTAPYALQNDFERAQSDIAGIGLEDLNDVEPAAGDMEPGPLKSDPDAAYDEEAADELYYDEQAPEGEKKTGDKAGANAQ